MKFEISLGSRNDLNILFNVDLKYHIKSYLVRDI
jgi:hypothetical protein